MKVRVLANRVAELLFGAIYTGTVNIGDELGQLGRLGNRSNRSKKSGIKTHAWFRLPLEIEWQRALEMVAQATQKKNEE